MVEYALMLGLVTLIAAAAYIGLGNSMDTLWRVMNTRMTNAAS
jgi:Flp pilus assembly pilin Flp